jgi:2-desacetyl-2-hydroxyethyl bacteriochlorophyllide A dehydrogenase
MKAFLITNPGLTELGNVAKPAPGPGDLLLRTRYIGLCGTDLNTFRGQNPMVTYPRIPGHEIAATVVDAGAAVPTQFEPGTDVTVSPYTNCGTCASCRRGRTNACMSNQTLGVQRDGAMQEYFIVPWQKVFVANGLSLRELTLVEPLGVGFHTVARGRVTDTDTVAVIGCGAVGLGAVAASAFRGANTVIIDIDDAKLAIAKRAGAHHSINSRSEDVHARLKDLTDGHGPDVVIEAVGSPATYRMAIEEVAFTGRVVYVGYSKEPVTYETKYFVQKELDILGSRNSLDEFPEVIAMLLQGRFPVESTISKVVSLEQAGEALAGWAAAPQTITKILVELT